MAQLVDQAILDDKEYLAALKRIDANVTKMTKDAQKNFDGVAQSAKSSGIQMGAVAGLVGAITTKFIELGQKAVSAIADITAESVSLAANLEVTEKVFTGIFQGNKKAAIAALGEIRDESRKLGVDLTETAATFAPFVKNVEQLQRIGKIGSALALSQPEQGSGGVRIALQEFLSGNARSLIQRFEIPKQFGAELQKALDEGGIEAALTKFEDILKILGRDIDTLGGGFQQVQGQAKIAAQQLQEAFGKPIVAELTNQLNELVSTVSENFDDIELVADAFGRVAANIVSIIGSGLNDFLATLDSEQLTRIAEKLFDITEDARLLITTLAGAEFPQNFIDGVEAFATKLDQALTTANQLALLYNAGLAQEQAESTKALEMGISILGKGLTTKSPLIDLYADAAQKAEIAAAGTEAYNKVLLDGVKAIDESAQARDKNRQATDEMAEAQKKSNQAGLDEANTFLEQKNRLAELAQLKEDAAAAAQKVAEKQAEAAKDYQRDLLKIEVEFERKRSDILLDAAREREQAAKNNLDKLADIRRDAARDADRAERELGRDLADIDRKYQDDRIEAERDKRQKRLDLEKDYRRRLQDITRQADADLDDAANKRDAVQFLAILKKKNEDIQSAQLDRQQSIEDLRVESQQRQEELSRRREQEREQAKIDYQRQREDQAIALQQAIEDQNIAYQRELEQISTKEQQKLEDLNTWRTREREDALTSYNQKLEDLGQSLQAELDLIKQYNAQMEAEAQRHAAAMASQQTTVQGGTGQKSGTPYYSSRQGAINQQRQQSTYASSRQGMVNQQRQYPGRASGGPVLRGYPYLVGEKGPELFTPSQSGRIIPNNAMQLPNFERPNVISNNTYNNQRSASLGGMIDPGSLDSILASKIENVLIRVLDKLG